MDRFPLDRFSADPPQPPTFSSPQPQPLPPPSQSSLRSSDEPDPFKISFLKGPKRKRLAKACDACHKSKRRCDGTAPCSNCYFAAKDCTYTDASGRPVPAPVASNTDKPSRPGPSQPRRRSHKEPALESPVSPATSTLPFKRTEPLTSLQAPSDARDDYAENSKRPRVGSISTPVPPTPLSTFAAIRLDIPVVRELVNLFFVHCQPHRLIFHQPTFMVDVCLGRVPSYLLYALCALAAPFSKSPLVRTDLPRTAGSPYAKRAEELMFDSHGRLSADRNLLAVQTLCLLETHQSILSSPWPSSSTHHQLALSILKEDIHIQDEYHSSLPSAPTTSFELDAIGRECAQRAFWYIRLMRLTTFTYFHIPVPPFPMDLKLRLPVDEASFEFGRHNGQSEYLHLPAPRTPFVSEFGHLLRIASMHGRLEAILSAVGARHDAANVVMEETEMEVSAWELSLSDHVRFSEESAAFHLSMFETSSNAGAWCFFMMHTVYAWCLLMLSEGKSRGSSAMAKSRREWACDRLLSIGTKLGHRAKNSVLIVAVILALSRFGMSDHPQVVTWAREYAEACGVDPPTKTTGKLPMPIAEVLGSVRRPTLPPLSPTPAPSTGADRLEDRSDTSSTSSSGAYFSSLWSSYNKLRITNSEPAPPGPAQSLPSLKSSGLLESRPYQPQPSWSPDGGASEHPGSPTPPWIALRMANEPKESVPGSSEPTTSPTATSRSGLKPTMPVGLDWLANEQ